jgi:hypothetical protein
MRPGQPLPAVEADLDGERKPGLDAGVHEAGHRVDLVMIQMQALAVTWDQLQAFGLGVAHDLIPQAGFDSGEDADQSLLDAVRPGDFAGDLFLVGGARSQIADRPRRVFGQCLRCVPQLPGERFAMAGKVLQQHLHRPKITIHPGAAGQHP